MIRLTGGAFRGRMIDCPKGKAVRPTTAFVRQSLFNILARRVIDARVLDLFAGCGIVGFEAISRGALHVTAVEHQGSHCKILEKNREILKLSPQAYQIIGRDVFDWMKIPPREAYDLIFLDPPYALENADVVVRQCFANGWLAPDGMLVWESRQKTPPVFEGAEWQETRQYGASTLSFFTNLTSP